jgi:hypothetical protein
MSFDLTCCDWEPDSNQVFKLKSLTLRYDLSRIHAKKHVNASWFYLSFYYHMSHYWTSRTYGNVKAVKFDIEARCY